METLLRLLNAVASNAGDICTIATCLALLVKPIREKIFGLAAITEGVRCLLRAEIVRIYYKHIDDKQLKEYEYKMLDQCHKAYKALGGNSFIDHIFAEMQGWDII